MAGHAHNATRWPIADGRFAIVTSRFHGTITQRLVDGARRVLADLDVAAENIATVWVPGAYELPLATQQLASSGRYDGIVALGCVVQGETPHFEYVCTACAHGIMNVMLGTAVPVAFGVLTTTTLAQAEARAGVGADNKGAEAAQAVAEMVALLRRIASGTETVGR